MTDSNTAVLIFGKTPIPGQVKTRLEAEYSVEKCLAIYQKLLRQTVTTVSLIDDWDIYLWSTPTIHHPYLISLAEEFNIELRSQQGTTLGERMLSACRETLANYTKVIIIGCDCPELVTADLSNSIEKLNSGYDVILGPASDGGYYLIALTQPYQQLFANIDWGTETVLSQTKDIAEEMELSYFELDEKNDLDRPEDYLKLKHLFD